MKHSLSQSNSGFTLIELVAVIILLGILSVSAAPKFINLTDDAHKAKNQGFFAAFSSAIKLVEAKARVQNKPQYGRVVIDGTTIKLYEYWPECRVGSNANFCPDNDIKMDGRSADYECSDIWSAIMFEANSEYDVKGDGTTDFTCQFRLKDQPEVGFNFRSKDRILVIVEPN